MALTEAEFAYLRTELGSTIDELDLDDRHDRLGSAVAVAAEVIRERLATVLAGPSSFTIPGVYSESTNDGVVKALQEQAKRLKDEAAAPAAEGGTGRVVRLDRVR